MTDHLINQTFQERYQIQSLLGRQTGRRTFLAKDLQTQSQVVVKLLLFNPDFTWDDLKLFQREAETLRNLDHLAIPQYLDYFEVETEIGKGSALVQSYIEAKSLQDWAESGRSFSETELKAIATQLLEVLQYLHSHLPPVIHRDIKPSNILLTDRSGNSPGTVYLVDFGSVQTVIQSGTITVVGTYGYMPPEQFGGKTTPASDLYSLGATLIYLITRKHPADLPTRRGRIQFEVNSQISQRFQAWIKCLIQPDLEKRFNTAQKALEKLQSDTFPLDSFPTTNARPFGSRVSLKKTDKQLQIILPSMSIRQKLDAIFGTVLLTLLLCIPSLIIFLLTDYLIITGTAIIVIAAVVLWTWINTIYNSFKEIRVSIKQQNIIYIIRSLLIKSQKRMPIKEIVKLEKSWHSINIWVNNICYPIEPLTSMEVEWLTNEISDWLDLPIQQSDKLTKDSLSEASKSIPADSSSLSTIKPPSQPQCHIEKIDNILEVSAPAKTNSGCLGCLVVLVFFITSFTFCRTLGLGEGGAFWTSIAMTFASSIVYVDMNNKRKDDQIILRIDRNIACLYQKSHPEKYLNQTYTKNILNIEVVCRSPRQYNSTCYHVTLKTDLRDQLLVGNHQFWLSEYEAYWIAYELSKWLKIPVTEREVIDTAY